MKILKYIVVCLFMLKTLSAQTILTFSPDSTKWTQQTGFWGGSFGNIFYNYYYSNNFIKGDTTVNNKFLQKLFNAGTTTKIDTACYSFHTYMYNDSNRIYAGNDPDSLLIIYNYNLAKGDSFLIHGSVNNSGPQPQTYYPKVDSINTIFYAGKNRKWIRFALLPYNTRVIWLEGVGDINYGLVWNYSNIMFFNSLNTSLSGFDCFIDGDNKSIHGSCAFQNCNVGVERFTENDEVVLYPIPCDDILTIEVNKNNKVRIIDILGNEIKINYEENSATLKFNTSGLPNGIYSIQLKTAAGVVTKKIIIQH